MSKPASSFLRVHREDNSSASTKPQLSPADSFWNAFSAATGWRVDSHHQSERVRVLPAIEMNLMEDGFDGTTPPVIEENAAELAIQASAMADEIARLQGVVSQQEIELAAHCVAEISDSQSDDLSKRVQQTIEQAIAATGFHSAAVYLLDDDTEFLHTRAVVGLPSDRLECPPRPLRGSRADLEAMVQEVVLIDDLAGPIRETWNVPEECGAAVCTAILKGDLPIGTLWFFSDRPRQLNSSYAAVAQMASAKLTLELSDAVKSRQETRNQKSHQAIRELAEWQFTSLPAGSQLAPGWFVDGMIETPNAWSIGWHHWDVLPDGMLMVSFAEAIDEGANGAMVAATARAALTAHAGYRHTPPQIIQRVGDTMWQTNSSEQLVSLLYAQMDPETGAGEVVAAGNVFGLISGPYGYRPLIQHRRPPLGDSFDVDVVESTFHLRADETLLVYGMGLEKDGVRQDLLGRVLKSAMEDKQVPLPMIRREIASYSNLHERGLLSITRRSARN